LRSLPKTGLILLLAACGGSSYTPAPDAQPAQVDDPRARAQAAAKIAKEILDNPNDGSTVLKKHEMSPDEFSDLMYEIAGDPELAEVYDTVRG
jgi:hypothetical protein